MITAAKGSEKIVVCMTCKNAAITIPYVLQSILKANHDGYLSGIIIVDGGSSDDTVLVAKRILERSGIPYKIIVENCNISEGRNICIREALKMNANHILFIDADVVLAHRNLINYMLAVERACGPCLVHAKIIRKNFSTMRELDEFCRKVLRSLSNQPEAKLHVKPIRWCGMGLTLIPRCIAETISFPEDMAFLEDRYYGLLAWEKGYAVYCLESSQPLAFDVNLLKHSDIYIKIGLREYLRGNRKRALALAYHYYSSQLTKSLLKILREEGLKVIYHALSSTLAALSLLLLVVTGFNPPFIILLTPALTMDTAFIIKHRLRRCNTLRNAIIDLVKFRLASLIVYPLAVLALIKNKRRFQNVVSMQEETRCEPLFG